ncbi:class I SAM-dependent methyltransferase [Paracidovorax cattleyae]|uniref:Methyltransferase domain-containing protein n=1 Tax=Paracidovorax cattleyae TaxID=80868 RepID=A0A1H0W7C5_9BURK|nr:class I SAM-dependent methyltransferase [Paracidovorax cattleyae]MBF9266224.1 class I SAM-dependent methyltransferase [Paracidovorax cattleyae]SDP86634.1 Methyltransferase domain-containing protein [Paracidovorax cattleyae]
MRWTSQADYNDPASLSARLRARRMQLFMELVRDCYRRQGHCRVIDVGGTPAYWAQVEDTFFAENHCEVTVVNLDAHSGSPPRPHLRLCFGDGCALAFGDNAFDLAHSNSVIEHVGDAARMQAFAGEIRRVAPRYYVQTPNYWFPIEPHYLAPAIQFLPRAWQAELLYRLPLGRVPRPSTRAQARRFVEGIQLLTRRDMARLFPDGMLVGERFCGLTKSWMAVRR